MNNKTEKMQELLVALLDCGHGDLSTILETEYDFYDIVEEARHLGDKIDLGSLIYTVMRMGLSDLQEQIEGRIEELKEALEEGDHEYTEEEVTEIEELIETGVNTDEDFDLFINFMDSHVWFNDDKTATVYHKYFEEQLQTFTFNTGFEV